METMKSQLDLRGSFLKAAVLTAIILFIPLVAMQLTSEVDWSLSDFVIMGALLFCVLVTLFAALQFASTWSYRLGLFVALGTTLLMMWANLAVGLIGSGPNIGNIMFFGISVLVVIGVVVSRFQTWTLERTMYLAAAGVAIATIASLVLGLFASAGSSVVEVIGIGAFFMAPYIVAGLLFRQSREK